MITVSSINFYVSGASASLGERISLPWPHTSVLHRLQGVLGTYFASFHLGQHQKSLGEHRARTLLQNYQYIVIVAALHRALTLLHFGKLQLMNHRAHYHILVDLSLGLSYFKLHQGSQGICNSNLILSAGCEMIWNVSSFLENPAGRKNETKKKH